MVAFYHITEFWILNYL